MACLLSGHTFFGYDLRPKAITGYTPDDYRRRSIPWKISATFWLALSIASAVYTLRTLAWAQKKRQVIRPFLFFNLSTALCHVSRVRGLTYAKYGREMQVLGDPYASHHSEPPLPQASVSKDERLARVKSLQFLCTEIVAQQPAERLRLWSLDAVLPPPSDHSVTNDFVRSAAKHGAAQLVAMCLQLPRITELDLGPVGDEITAEQAHEIFHACRKLKSVSLKNCRHLDGAVLRDLMAACPEIETLDLTGFEGVDALGTGLPKLRSLNLTGCEKDKVEILLQTLQSPLVTLRLPDGFPLWPTVSWSYLPVYGYNMRTLSANFDRPTTLVDSFHRIPHEFPEECTQLEAWHLDLDECQRRLTTQKSREELTALWTNTNNSRGRERLISVLVNPRVADFDLPAFPEVPEWASEHLTSLSLYGSCPALGLQEVLARLCGPLRALISLRVGLLPENTILELAASLKTHAPQLKKLQLVLAPNNSITMTNSDVDALAEACPGLTELSLGIDIRLNHSICKRLAEKLPELRSLGAWVIGEEEAFDPSVFASMTELMIPIPDILETLKACPHLTKMSCRSMFLQTAESSTFESDFAELLASRGDLCPLETLAVKVTAFNQEAVISIFAQCPNAKEVWLTVLGTVVDEQWQELVQKLPPQTERLMFCGGGVTIHHMRTAMTACPRITSAGVCLHNDLAGIVREFRHTSPPHLKQLCGIDNNSNLSSILGPIDRSWVDVWWYGPRV